MGKLVSFLLAALFLTPGANSVHERFAKYKPVEAYEIRPGVLMMPQYSADGQVCELGLERRHYSPETIRLDSGLSREEIDQVFDELVPADERGPRSKDFEGTLITEGGHGITSSVDFQNVTIQIFGRELPPAGPNEIREVDIAASLHWKNRPCQ